MVVELGIVNPLKCRTTLLVGNDQYELLPAYKWNNDEEWKHEDFSWRFVGNAEGKAPSSKVTPEKAPFVIGQLQEQWTITRKRGIRLL